MIDKFVNYLIKENVIQSEEADIYSYGVFVILFNILCISAIIFIGVLFKDVQFSLYFLLFFVPIRILLGGFHCQTAPHCFVFFNTLYVMIMLLRKYFQNQLIMVICIILLCICLIDYIRQKNNIFYTCLLIGLSFLFFIIEIFNSRLTLYISSAFFLSSLLYIIKKCLPNNSKKIV